MKTQEFAEFGLVEGTCVRIDYSNMEVYGIYHHLENGKLQLSDSVITKSNIKRGEKIVDIFIKKNDFCKLELIDSLRVITPSSYKEDLKNMDCKNLEESEVNYYMVSQYLLQNCVMNIDNKKDIFVFENEKVIDFHVAQKCVPNNFYYFVLKTNETKANRMYLYQDGDSFTVDFISEWKDKQKGITVRNIKKSIENISIDNLMMILKTI